MNRVVAPEWLDVLPVADRRAVRSRRDLRRVNYWMGNRRRMAASLRSVFRGRPPLRLAELGAGDGTFFLHLARSLGGAWPGMEVTLVDRQPAISEATRLGIEACGWRARVVTADVFDWLAGEQEFDALAANLFLHHFESEALSRLLTLVSKRTSTFVACEPHRSSAGCLFGGRFLWLLGCNEVTRHDARISVRAGFRGTELSSHWPGGQWRLEERRAGLFSQLFVARRNGA